MPFYLLPGCCPPPLAAYGGGQVLYSLASPANAVNRAPQNPNPPKIRKEFPETWIWETVDEERLISNPDCTTRVKKKAVIGTLVMVKQLLSLAEPSNVLSCP